MKIKLLLLLVVFFTLQTNAQTVTALQQQNSRATGYAIVAARNPGKSFAVLMIKWDGIHDLEYNANTQINPSWHPQAAVKGNFFNQTFDGNDFTMYSAVLVSQAEFDIYKNTGQDWWIVCSNLPTFSNSGLTIADNGRVGIGTTTPASLLDLQKSYGNDVGIKLSQLGSSIWDIKNTATTGLFTIGAGGGTYFNIDKLGNVGIGATTPSGKLDVIGSFAEVSLNANSIATANFRTPGHVQLAINTSVTVPYTTSLQAKHATADGGSFPIALNPLGGNVGIGTTNPIYKLDTGVLAFDTADGGTIRFGQGERDAVGDKYPTSIKAFFKAPNPVDLGLNFYVANANTAGATELDRKKLVATMLGNGNVGIGTTDPQNKLSVNGTIWAKEVKVSLTDAADWVFEKNYKLKPLAEVEKYINENKHLPEVPSAEEFRQNDMNVSEMSNKLLQKIEELTLYAIEQNKVIEELKNQVATLMEKKQ